jgi:hypothetical protein
VIGKRLIERVADQWDAEMEKALADGVFDDMIEAAIAEDDAGTAEEL